MKSFVYNAQPSRVVFGSGSVTQLRDEISKLGLSRVLVLSTLGQRSMAEQVSEQLGELSAGIYDQAVMHVPIESARKGIEAVQQANAEGCVAIGGGSTIGLGKAIALETGLPVIAVPTTYSGSEMTSIWGLTENGVKSTGRDPKVLPRTVIYDPNLTVGLPVGLSATSGMNAIAHCVEALYAEDANPVTSLMAEEGIRALGQGLPKLVREPSNLDARTEALYGSWLAGTSLGAVGMALHHKLCHTLGGSFNLPHAEVHTIVLSHATAYNAAAAPEAMQRIERALNVENASAGLFDLAASLNTPLALKDIGMNEEYLDKATDIAIQNPYYNPSEVTREGIRELLQNAYEGNRPG